MDNGALQLSWEVVVLRNDSGQELRIAENARQFVSLGANLWKEDDKDTDETEAAAFALPFLEHVPLTEYQGLSENDGNA